MLHPITNSVYSLSFLNKYLMVHILLYFILLYFFYIGKVPLGGQAGC